ncbi:hypothetical protein DL98DRAFT_583547 [Cadophora sp. DSE1049]|nr:hypothetical protein DL98DRAFT_583547 [Cadophora sp. DSE1049]
MKTTHALAAVLAAILTGVNAKASIRTTGTATGCGQSACCIPNCQLTWTDGNGCSDGIARGGGNCNGAFDGKTDEDTGVDIFDGSGAFFCKHSDGGKIVYVVNRDDDLSAARFPATYDACTLSGQYAPCDSQGSCQDPVSIGTAGDHTCRHSSEFCLTAAKPLTPAKGRQLT